MNGVALYVGFRMRKSLNTKVPWLQYGAAMMGILFVILITAKTTYGANTMKTIYSLNRAVMPVLEPTVYSIKKIEMRGLMQIPIDDAVATNAMPNTNAVTLIEFTDTKVKYKTIAKDFKNYVGGGDIVYLPIFSEDTIGYSQTRGFNLLNIKTKQNQAYSIIGDTNYRINKIAVFNAEKKLFLFGIKVFGSEEPLQVFRLMDLSSSEGKALQEKIIDGKYGWTYSDNTIFLNDLKTNGNIMAMDMKLEECEHPFVTYINANKSRFNRLVSINMHPTLPFAIIPIEGGHATQIVTWNNQDGKMHEFMLFNAIDGLQCNYKFSNDGKWLYFGEYSISREKEDFILMPVDPTLLHYLGKPIYLGEVPKYPENEAAMTRNPAGLVVTHYGGDFLLEKWDFTKVLPLIEKEK